MTGRNTDLTLTPPRAHGTPPRPRAGSGGGIPGAAERAVLGRTLGAELKSVRAGAGMSQRVLAARAGVSYRSVQDLEAGRRRPSLAMLNALAVGSTRRVPPVAGLAPGPVCARLVAAAGVSVVVDTPGGVRRRQRRLRAAGHLHLRAVRAWWAGEVTAAQRAELEFVAAINLIDQPGALDDPAALTRIGQHLDAHRAWMRSGRHGPFGTTSAFRAMARRNGYRVSRVNRRSA